MSAEFSANAVQTVNPGQAIVFTSTDIPCGCGKIKHREGSGNFLVLGCSRSCNNSKSVDNIAVDFGANIAIPTGGTVGPISVSLAIDGSNIATTNMVVNPAAVEDYFNVSRATNVGIWRGCCETVTVVNTSDQPILVQNANIVFN